MKATVAELQQPLPFTVLKLVSPCSKIPETGVATALTVYGIETSSPMLAFIPNHMRVATALTVYGIETAPPALIQGVI